MPPPPSQHHHLQRFPTIATMPAPKPNNKQARHRTFYSPLATSLQPILTHLYPATTSHSHHLLLPTNDTFTFISPSSSPYNPKSSNNSDENVSNLVTSVSLSTDASVALVASRSGHLTLHNLPSNKNQPIASSRVFRPFHDTRVVSISAFHPANQHFVIASTDGAIRVHQTDTLAATHVFNVESIVSYVAFHPSGQDTHLFIAKEDGQVWVYDLAKKKSTPIITYSNHVSKVNSLAFINNGNTLISAAADSTLVYTDITKYKSKHAQPKVISTDEAIVSVVAPMGQNSRFVLTVGEKGLVRVWDQQGREQTAKSLKLPFLNEIKSNLNEKDDDEDDDENDEISVVNMRESGSDRVVITLSDQTILFVSVSENGELSLQENVLCGNLEEIYDVKAVGESADNSTSTDRDFALASNSSCLWIMRYHGEEKHNVFTDNKVNKKQNKKELVVDQDEKKIGSWSCRAGLQGHSGLLLAVDVHTGKRLDSDNLTDAYIASSSRDKTARVWRRSRTTGQWVCMAIAEGHTDAVGAVAISQRINEGQFYIVTGAADKTIKLWKLDQAKRSIDASEHEKCKKVKNNSASTIEEHDDPIRLSTKWTALAHKKDVNAVAISPDCKVIATGSQDRIMKLWDSDKGALLHSCQGHKRGIWSVCFSQVDKVVATSSGDGTIRIWNVANGSCLRTLQGHLAGVLKTMFISSGTQVASCGADGLLKVWVTRSGECVATEDAHDERAWALDAIDDGSAIVSGGADGVVQIWSDRTQAKEEEARKKRDEDALVSQAVENAARGRKWTVAVRGALDLNLTQKLKKVIEHLIVTEEKPQESLRKVLLELKDVKKGTDDNAFWKLIGRLMTCCRDWNCVGGSKSAATTAHVLQAVFSTWRCNTLCEKLPGEQRALVEALEAHCKRHLDRVSQIVTRAAILEHTLNEMKSLGTIEETAQANKRKQKTESKQSELVENGKTGIKRRRKGRDVYPVEY